MLDQTYLSNPLDMERDRYASESPVAIEKTYAKSKSPGIVIESSYTKSKGSFLQNRSQSTSNQASSYSAIKAIPQRRTSNNV